MKIADILIEARRSGFALGAFNCISFESMYGVALAARDLFAPVIIQTSSRLVRKLGVGILRGWFETVQRNVWKKCFLHLDHCTDRNLIEACINGGWDMVMFDGSAFPLMENCRKCAEIVAYAHARGVAVEGEIGGIMGEEDGRSSHNFYADPSSAAYMAQCTGIDCLAVGFGNVHGCYADKSLLRWELFEEVGKKVSLPLVLHGGSGLSEAEFHRAIRAGAAKVNISTELKRVYTALPAHKEDLGKTNDPSDLHAWLTMQCAAVAANHMRSFCIDKGITVDSSKV